jgi:hypothetical protein
MKRFKAFYKFSIWIKIFDPIPNSLYYTKVMPFKPGNIYEEICVKLRKLIYLGLQNSH